MKAEFNAEIVELRRELRAEHDAIVAQIKSVFETEVAKTIGRGPRGAEQASGAELRLAMYSQTGRFGRGPLAMPAIPRFVEKGHPSSPCR